MNKKVLGKLSFTYCDLVMPLEVAHKIQALLAEHAVRVDSIYCGGRNPEVCVEIDYDITDVSIAKPFDFDCKGIKPKTLAEWRQIVSDRETGAPIMDPHDFANIRGEEQ